MFMLLKRTFNDPTNLCVGQPLHNGIVEHVSRQVRSRRGQEGLEDVQDNLEDRATSEE